MKIAINCRHLLKNKLEGIGWYTFEIVKRIIQQHPEHEYFLLFDRPFHPDFVFSKNVTPIILSPQARHPFLWFIWFEYSVTHFLKKNKIDLFFSPDGYLSLRTKTKTVLTVHDLNFEHFPEQLPKITAFYYRYFMPQFCKKAHAILTVSESSKQDIIKQYGTDSTKITVIYNGANSLYQPITKEEMQLTKNNYTNGAEYFYFVGSLHPRKNIVNLIKGFYQFLERTNANCKLLIIGELMWKNQTISQLISESEYKEQVQFLGRKEIEDLKNIAGSALALAFVPFIEGFGIPLAEAMYCHTPIITSETSCLPEIAGNTAIYAHPNSVNSIADAFTELFTNREKRQELSKHCIQRKRLFSWDNAANETWNILEKTLNA